jgi:hypothetical protein
MFNQDEGYLDRIWEGAGKNRPEVTVSVPCKHKACKQCKGTGKKDDGTPCIHHLACMCPKCNIGHLESTEISF